MQFIIFDIESCGPIGHMPILDYKHIVPIALVSTISYSELNKFSIALINNTDPLTILNALPGEISLVLGPGHKQAALAHMLRILGYAVYNICTAEDLRRLARDIPYDDYI